MTGLISKSHLFQKISLGKGCGMYPITVTRQIFHALGFWNEEMRPDRDPKKNAYVINQNIAPHLQFNLNATFKNWNDLGEPYDVKLRSKIFHNIILMIYLLQCRHGRFATIRLRYRFCKKPLWNQLHNF